MKRDVKAEIIENMDPKFSAEILKIIATRKLSG
jgi:flagellar motility protein MotE (MotC chaperone)